jgi:hypothetical protein
MELIQKMSDYFYVFRVKRGMGHQKYYRVCRIKNTGYTIMQAKHTMFFWCENYTVTEHLRDTRFETSSDESFVKTYDSLESFVLSIKPKKLEECEDKIEELRKQLEDQIDYKNEYLNTTIIL